MIAALILSSCAGITISERIQINERADVYELDVPISKLVMFIPKKGFSQKDNQQGGGTNNPRYFYFKNELEKIIISGWFEPAQKYSGVKAIMQNDAKARVNAKLSAPENVSFVKEDNWEAVFFDQTYQGFTNFHLRAHWIQSGTWIDVHISGISASPSPEARRKLLALLKTFEIKEK